MTRVHYRQISLNSAALQNLLSTHANRSLGSLQESNTDQNLEVSFQTHQNNPSELSTFARIQQTPFGASSDQSRRIYSVALTRCTGAYSCESAEREAETLMLDLSAWHFLSPNVRITEAFSVDANEDGWNDLVIQLSDGQGFLFQASPVMAPRRPRPSRPVSPHADSTPNRSPFPNPSVPSTEDGPARRHSNE